MTTIIPAISRDHFQIIETLAFTIWTEHYTPIIGAEQVRYMLKKFQTAKAIEDQVNEGYSYYLMEFQEEPVGYFSYKTTDDHLFLSKLYVDSSMRGNGIGRAGMNFIEEQTRTLGLKKIRLTINKYNTNSYKAYQKLGFVNVDSVVMDIGGGFVMDDYVMEKIMN